MPKENEKKVRKPRYKICVAEGCRKPRARRSLCVEHFAKEYPGKKPAAVSAPEAAPAASAPAES